MKTISIDIGGTYIKWAIIDENYNIIEKGKFPTDAFTLRADGIFKNVGSKINELSTKYKDINSIGLSVPGVVNSKTGVVFLSTKNIPKSQGMNIKEEMKKYTKIPVHVINDANAATLGEKANGNLKDCNNGALITIGTGIGGGIIINGDIYQGSLYAAGEVGRHFVDNGSWESRYSIRSLINEVSLTLGRTDINGEDVIMMSEQLPIVEEIFERWIEGIAKGISNIINILNPEVVAISGGISENIKFDIKRIQNYISKYVQPEVLNLTKIVKSSSGNDAALYGVALFSREQI